MTPGHLCGYGTIYLPRANHACGHMYEKKMMSHTLLEVLLSLRIPKSCIMWSGKIMTAFSFLLLIGGVPRVLRASICLQNPKKTSEAVPNVCILLVDYAVTVVLSQPSTIIDNRQITYMWITTHQSTLKKPSSASCIKFQKFYKDSKDTIRSLKPAEPFDCCSHKTAITNLTLQ